MSKSSVRRANAKNAKREAEWLFKATKIKKPKPDGFGRSPNATRCWIFRDDFVVWNSVHQMKIHPRYDNLESLLSDKLPEELVEHALGFHENTIDIVVTVNTLFQDLPLRKGEPTLWNDVLFLCGLNTEEKRNQFYYALSLVLALSTDTKECIPVFLSDSNHDAFPKFA